MVCFGWRMENFYTTNKKDSWIFLSKSLYVMTELLDEHIEKGTEIPFHFLDWQFTPQGTHWFLFCRFVNFLSKELLLRLNSHIFEQFPHHQDSRHISESDVNHTFFNASWFSNDQVSLCWFSSEGWQQSTSWFFFHLFLAFEPFHHVPAYIHFP